MERHLKKSLNRSTIVLSLLAVVASVYIIKLNLNFEKAHFTNDLARLVNLDFAQIESKNAQADQQFSQAIDKYNLIAGDRFSISSTEIFDSNESGDFVFASVGDRQVRFKVQVLNSYFVERVIGMGLLAFLTFSLMIYLVRLVFVKLVLQDILLSNKLLNEILDVSYAQNLTQEEFIKKAQAIKNQHIVPNQLCTIHRVLRRIVRLPTSRT